MKKVLAIAVLSVFLVACNAATVANLISLGTQVAVDVISVVGAFQGQADTADIAAAQQIGAQAQKDWTDLTNAYNQYEANKSASNLQNVSNAAAALENNLTTLLADAHIKNQVLLARVTAAVDTIITVVDQVATDLGTTVPSSPAAHAHAHLAAGSVKAQVNGIKAMWNNTVVKPTGDSAVDAALEKAKL